MSQSEIDDYLMSSNLMTRGEICQTTALEEFDLEVCTCAFLRDGSTIG